MAERRLGEDEGSMGIVITPLGDRQAREKKSNLKAEKETVGQAND